jgi:hypothetical protein
MALYFSTAPRTGIVDPTNALDLTAGYFVGQKYINTATLNEFTCISNAAGAAVWRHTPRILAFGNTQLANTGNTTENIKATVSLVANLLGANGVITIMSIWSATNNANSKTRRIRWGAAASGAGGTVIRGIAAASWLTARDYTEFSNRNATNAQVAGMSGGDVGGFAQGTVALATPAIDTTAATELNFTAQCADAGDTLAIEQYRVELRRPDIT